MKTNEFIAKLRKGNNSGGLEITIPPKFQRMNGLVLGHEYIFTIKDMEGGEDVFKVLSVGNGDSGTQTESKEFQPI